MPLRPTQRARAGFHFYRNAHTNIAYQFLHGIWRISQNNNALNALRARHAFNGAHQYRPPTKLAIQVARHSGATKLRISNNESNNGARLTRRTNININARRR